MSLDSDMTSFVPCFWMRVRASGRDMWTPNLWTTKDSLGASRPSSPLPNSLQRKENCCPRVEPSMHNKELLSIAGMNENVQWIVGDRQPDF